MELRDAFLDTGDLEIVYVMAKRQVNPKSVRFIEGLGIHERVTFARDPESRAIDALAIRRPEPEAMEEGVPHPATYLIDRDGTVRFVDVREDYHIWIDPSAIVAALAAVP